MGAPLCKRTQDFGILIVPVTGPRVHAFCDKRSAQNAQNLRKRIKSMQSEAIEMGMLGPCARAMIPLARGDRLNATSLFAQLSSL